MADEKLAATPAFRVGETNPDGDDPHEFPCADEGGGTKWGFTAYSQAGTLFATAATDPSTIAVAADDGDGFRPLRGPCPVQRRRAARDGREPGREGRRGALR